jgi:ubiquinol-cytochrome c reductase iron-sulfur subunit
VTAVGGGGPHPREKDHAFEVLSWSEPEPSEANDLIVVAAAGVAGTAGLAFGILLLAGAPLLAYGLALAVALLSLGVAVRRFFIDRFPDVWGAEPRYAEADLGPADPGARIADVRALPRRSLLVRMLAAAGALVGLGLAAPIVSLGPAPGEALRRTDWRNGVRLVTPNGRPIRPDDVAAGGIATVWPEDAVGSELSAVVLVRLSGGPAEPPTEGRWVIDHALVAYSKVCTHAGCPVALFRERDNALFCPCHQSTFDARRGASPTFGPAARALPQLPLGLDGDGFLIALGDFEQQVGPAFG